VRSIQIEQCGGRPKADGLGLEGDGDEEEK